MTNNGSYQNWEDEQLAKLYDAVLSRMVITYCLNELVKSGVKTPLKAGMIEKLREMQKQRNFVITNTVRRIDRGTQD